MPKFEVFESKREAELALEGIFLECDIDSRIEEITNHLDFCEACHTIGGYCGMCNGAYWEHEEFIQDENGFWQPNGEKRDAYDEDHLLGQMLEKEDRDRECTCGSGETWSNCTANTQYCG